VSRGAWTIARINLKNLKIPYLITGTLTAVMLIRTAVTCIAVANGGSAGSAEISGGCYLWLLPVLAAVFTPAVNFRRFINIGGRRDNFLWGSLLSYVIIAGGVSLLNLLIYYTFDRFVTAAGFFKYGVINLINLYGWAQRGVFVSFIRQFVFLLLVAVAVHTLAAIQDRWYGVAVNLLLAAVFIFLPVERLAAVMLWGFSLLLYHPNVVLQITVSLLLTALICVINKPIFARKVI